ncbi:NACHT domain-containing protein [Micromonospora echinospora]|uniref:NACHT domain-containing protein n=1 Tax=Micromonospora echinospora TaxID=1877 RepID=UPI003CE86CEC
MVALGVAVWALSRLELGDVDPVGGSIGFGSLLVGAAALVVAVRAWRWQQMDIAQLTERLATAVRDREQRARRQLLGNPGRVIDVQFEFRPAHNAEKASRQGRLRDVAAYYRNLRPGRMVITGAAGAGKTVLAIELIMALLEDRSPGDPVPVRLSASSWDLDADQLNEPAAAGQGMQQWVATHLVDVYRLSTRSAQALVDAGRILPVVDGLDELDATDQPGYASRAGQALRVFNAYQRYRSKAALVVTCRSGQYAALTTDSCWIEDAVQVEIRSVGVRQARKFITARAMEAGRWKRVLETITRDRNGPLALALATPWRLTLAVTIYEERGPTGEYLREPDELTRLTLGTPDGVRDHLLALFLPVALRSVARQPYDSALAHRWLAVLAGYLNRNAATGRILGGRPLSGTDIVLHELWPLAGSRRSRLVTLAIIAAIWLVELPVMATQLPVEFSPHSLLMPGALAAFGVLCLVSLSWSTFWPKPHRLTAAAFRTSHGRAGLAIVLMFGLLVGLLVGLTVGYAFGLALGLAFGLMSGIATVMVAQADVAAQGPRSIVRHDLALGFAVVLTFGLAYCWPLVFMMAIILVYALAASLVAVIVTAFLLGQPLAPLHLDGGIESQVVFGLMIGLLGATPLAFATISELRFNPGLAGLRYVALLLCTRRRSEQWLPWRLGRFLDLCYQAGLVRIAGNGYQFRHRELQDYLARHFVA